MRFSGGHVVIIAEVASSHEGRPDLAMALTRAAAHAGADAVKFQLFRADELVVAHHPKVDSFRQLELPPAAWADVVSIAREAGLGILADVYDLPSLNLAEQLEVEGYKITMTVVGDLPLLEGLAATGKPLLLAVGGETEEEIVTLLRFFDARSSPEIVLLHGFQGFPTCLQDTHLHRLSWLRERFRLPVGFADHSPGDLSVSAILPVVAVGLGACVIEKHLTWNRDAKGRDHVSALNPDEFAQMVRWVREVETALGESSPVRSEAEIRYRETMKKKVVARCSVPIGSLLGRRHVTLKRTPDPGVEAEALPQLVGKKILRSLARDEAVQSQDLVDPQGVILVAVRMKSHRLPGKTLLPLAGKPVLAHLIERVARAKLPKGVVVCTSTHPDDQRLLEWAAQVGVPAYAGSEDDVMDRFLEAADQYNADFVVRVTGDNPLTDSEAVDAMIDLHLKEGADYTFTEDLPRGTRPEIISVEALRRAHQLAEDPRHSEYMTLYFRGHPEIFTLAHWQAPESVRRPNYRLTLDTPEDLEVLQRVYETLHRDDVIFTLRDTVRLLDAHPEWVAINAHIAPRIPTEVNTRLRSPS